MALICRRLNCLRLDLHQNRVLTQARGWCPEKAKQNHMNEEKIIQEL